MIEKPTVWYNEQDHVKKFDSLDSLNAVDDIIALYHTSRE